MGPQCQMENLSVATRQAGAPKTNGAPVSQQMQQQQMLVRFENAARTFVIHLSQSIRISSREEAEGFIKHKISELVPGWRPEHLVVSNYAPPFCNCRVQSGIRGGKGGFGTLLKGQSRQASANTTKDFGDCRDLQGRRLRHVNDAVNYAVWKEWNEKVQAGTATLDEMAAALTNTDSGIAGWHLQLPAWSEVSYKKEHDRNKMLLRKFKREQEQKKAHKQEQRELVERQVAAYVQSADDATAKLESTISTALQQGLQKQAEANNKRLKLEPEPPVSLLTLSGSAILAQESEKWRLQSQSNFCTVGVVLDKVKVVASSKLSTLLYWEVALLTAGVVQIGWATAAFRPNSEAGDGVGDCAHSWGFDASRCIKLHAEAADSYGGGGGGAPYKAGDVVGCLYDSFLGEMSYTVNGKDLGVAFHTAIKAAFPALSCNPSEIVELRLNASELEYCPNGAVPVGDVVATEDVSLESLLEDDNDVEELEEKPVANGEPPRDDQNEKIGALKSDATAVSPPTPVVAIVVAEPLDLEAYESVDSLEQLGLDRLKGALMAAGLKCGGTLPERAARLFAVRGLKPEDYPAKLRAKK